MTEDLPEIRFVRALPGFPGLTRFALVQVVDPAAGAEPVLFELVSLERPEVRFVSAVPGPFFPDYQVELDEETVGELGLTQATDALTLVLLTLAGEGGRPTANLLAPVVINGRSSVASQVILAGDWPVRAELG